MLVRPVNWLGASHSPHGLHLKVRVLLHGTYLDVRFWPLADMAGINAGCPLLTQSGHRPLALAMSANDPRRTSVPPPMCISGRVGGSLQVHDHP